MLWNLLKDIIKEKDDEADDEKSIIKDYDQLIPENSTEKTEKDKSLKDELKSDVTKTVLKTLTGQGLNFNRIKIDENLLKKNILKVRYTNSNRRVNNKFLKEDYQISNNKKNAILKNTALNKLVKTNMMFTMYHKNIEKKMIIYNY